MFSNQLPVFKQQQQQQGFTFQGIQTQPSQVPRQLPPSQQLFQQEANLQPYRVLKYGQLLPKGDPPVRHRQRKRAPEPAKKS